MSMVIRVDKDSAESWLKGWQAYFEGSYKDVSVIQRDDERKKREVDEGWNSRGGYWDVF